MPSPRSTLFPYTTLFRSVVDMEDIKAGIPEYADAIVEQMTKVKTEKLLKKAVRRSEERFSRNAEPEIYTLSLHDALPICRGYGGYQSRNSGIRRCDSRTDDQGENREAAEKGGQKIGRAVQQECRARDLHSFPTRRSSDLSWIWRISKQEFRNTPMR